jgi:hypothetical protein
VEEQKKEAEKKSTLLEVRLEEHKKSFHENSKASEERIRELERKL